MTLPKLFHVNSSALICSDLNLPVSTVHAIVVHYVPTQLVLESFSILIIIMAYVNVLMHQIDIIIYLILFLITILIVFLMCDLLIEPFSTSDPNQMCF
jgi:hypothetical protein